MDQFDLAIRFFEERIARRRQMVDQQHRMALGLAADAANTGEDPSGNLKREHSGDEEGPDRQVRRTGRDDNNHAEEEKVQRCDVCRENRLVTDSVKLPCEHIYCKDCLEQFFQNAVADVASFPPRCCERRIDIEAVKHLVSDEMVIAFNRRTEELNTTDRTYCSSPTCSAFVSPEHIVNDRAHCPQCQTITCTICKEAAHQGEQCPESAALEQVLQVANERGWQRCLQCRRVVELTWGCNHMQCICGAHFCYACGLRWKTCDCTTWNERRTQEMRENPEMVRQELAARSEARRQLLAQAEAIVRDHVETEAPPRGPAHAAGAGQGPAVLDPVRAGLGVGLGVPIPDIDALLLGPNLAYREDVHPGDDLAYLADLPLGDIVPYLGLGPAIAAAQRRGQPLPPHDRLDCPHERVRHVLEPHDCDQCGQRFADILICRACDQHLCVVCRGNFMW